MSRPLKSIHEQEQDIAAQLRFANVDEFRAWRRRIRELLDREKGLYECKVDGGPTATDKN